MAEYKFRGRSMLTVNQDLNTRTIVVDGSGCILSLVFLEDGKHLLSGGQDGMIRQWRIEDAMEVGEAIKASGCVRAIALSSDRGWIISGEHSGATVWNRATRQKALAVNQHTDWVGTVDVSLDSTRFATGGLDKGVFIWDIATGTRLVGPLQHDNNLTAAKFAPSGDHIATTTWTAQSLRIYDAHTGELLRTVLVASSPTEPIAWSSDSQRIFAISSNVIRQIVVDTGAFERIVPGELSPILPRHGRFLAGFVGNSLTFWDAFSGERFGPVFDQPGGRLRSIALSLDSSYLATGRSNGIINLRKLSDFIPISNAIGQTIVQQSSLQNQAEIEVLRGELRALGLRVDNMTRQLAQSNHPPQAEVVPSLVSNGVYYIKSVIADVYLTFPQGATNTVVVQQWDQSNPAQRWIISHVANDVYRIMGSDGNSDVKLSIGKDNELVCVPDGRTWTIDPRGDAYVIGNAVDAIAIYPTQNPERVAVTPRKNNPEQRWILETVLKQERLVIESDEDIYAMLGTCGLE